jgi:hypothetical protein
MKSTQAWGWLTAGVLALGLNGFYQDGGAQWAHRAANQVIGGVAAKSEAVLALATGRADWFAAKSGELAAKDEVASCRVAAAMARLQTKGARARGGMARFEAASAREEAAFARIEADRARMEAKFARMRVEPADFNGACPRVRVNIPQVKIDLPGVHVDSF